MIMNGLSARLDQLEARLKGLVEGNLSDLLSERGLWDVLIQKMVAAMQSAIQIQSDGLTLGPDVYILLVNPEDRLATEFYPGLLSEFGEVIREAGENSGLKFSQVPVVSLSFNADIPTGSIEVVARNSQEGLIKTVKNEILADGDSGNIPPNTFLIVNGSRIFPLDHTVVNIGRRSTNDVVIDDQRVSRDHAQMRAIRGKYVLFDLNSTGGTFVNGQRISQRTLSPKDVISLAGIPIVYGQESIDAAVLVQTQKMSLSSTNADSSTKDNSL